jgi:hypothetical protein
LQQRTKAIHLSETKRDPEFVAFFEIADRVNDQVLDTLREIIPAEKTGRQAIYLHRWTIYLGTLLHELANASAQLLVLDMPRAAIVTIRQVFEYSIRTQYLHAHPDEAERLMDSLQWRILKEAESAPDYFSAELRQQYADNYKKWTEEHPELDSESREGQFTSWAREVLGNRFKSEFFRQYSQPSIIAHGKPHGVVDVLEAVSPEKMNHYLDSRLIDTLSELSKLASTTIEHVFFVRKKYELDLTEVIELNERHGAIQEQFGYIPKRPES